MFPFHPPFFSRAEPSHELVCSRWPKNNGKCSIHKTIQAFDCSEVRAEGRFAEGKVIIQLEYRGRTTGQPRGIVPWLRENPSSNKMRKTRVEHERLRLKKAESPSG